MVPIPVGTVGIFEDQKSLIMSSFEIKIRPFLVEYSLIINNPSIYLIWVFSRHCFTLSSHITRSSSRSVVPTGYSTNVSLVGSCAEFLQERLSPRIRADLPTFSWPFLYATCSIPVVWKLPVLTGSRRAFFTSWIRAEQAVSVLRKIHFNRCLPAYFSIWSTDLASRESRSHLRPVFIAYATKSFSSPLSRTSWIMFIEVPFSLSGPPQLRSVWFDFQVNFVTFLFNLMTDFLPKGLSLLFLLQSMSLRHSND